MPLAGSARKRWRRLTRVFNWEKAAALLCAKGRDHPRISVGSFFARIRGVCDMFPKPRKLPTIAPSAPPVPPSLIADLLSIAINHTAHASLPAQIRPSFTLVGGPAAPAQSSSPALSSHWSRAAVNHPGAL